MKKIGITGNIAAGKSTVENIILKQGFKVIDADVICHDGLENDIEIISKVKEIFAEFDIMDEKSNLNRKKIANIVFFNNIYKTKLENIIHPYVNEKIEEFCSNNLNEKIVFVSVPLLFEINMQKDFDKIILVTADENQRIERLINRNNITKEQAMARINAQIKQEEKIKLSDFIIENNDSLEILKMNTQKILADVLNLFE